jgi:dimethylhistidine N-methyltransferase
VSSHETRAERRDHAAGPRSRHPGRPGAARLAADVRAGLGGPGPRTLPSRWLYDALGSTLFEAIGLLPEYGLTRADERILRRHSPEIVDSLPAPLLVTELGSGSGRKTRWILEALAPRQLTTYFPIDISRPALARCVLEIGRLSGVRVDPIRADYLEGLGEVAARRRGDQRLLLLFLGSTIGNFDRREGERFLIEIRRLMQPGDALLLGTDLVKAVPRMIAAYDDPTGVTAAFDLNLLARINRELDADFDLRRFEHRARWHDAERRIEMHLVSSVPQIAVVRAIDLEVSFEAGESIWTESSHKYDPGEARMIAAHTGFECVGQWFDQEWEFAESLLLAK